MTTKKPDKYCAWHPEKGWLGDEYLLGMRSDFDGALEELREAFETEFQEACDKIAMDRDFVPWIRAQGWEIRPVCLISPERLEELENYEFMYKGLEK